MEALLHQFLSGLATGGIYASVALALVMIYQSTSQINFAQGEMAMFSTYIAWLMIQSGMPYWLAFAATVMLSFAMGAVVQFIAIRPVRDAPVLSVVVVYVGLLVIFNSLAGLLFGHTIKQFPSPFPADAWYATNYMGAHKVGAIAVALAVMALLFCFLRFTSLGLIMRGAADNADSARMVGIDVTYVLMLGWGLAAAIGAIAGMMVAPSIYLDPHMMTGVLIYSFAAALIGGIDNPMGAVVGGFLVGVMENLIGTYVVGTEIKFTVALVLIVGVLIVRPSGLFGKRIVAKL